MFARNASLATTATISAINSGETQDGPLRRRYDPVPAKRRGAAWTIRLPFRCSFSGSVAHLSKASMLTGNLKSQKELM